MNIAIAGVLTKPITENPFGGTETFTYLLIKGLVEEGHNVTLYSAKESKTHAQTHVPICSALNASKTISNVEMVYPYTLIQIKSMLSDLKDKKFDILHVNLLKTFLFSSFKKYFHLPVLHTMHRDYLQTEELANIYKNIDSNKKANYCFVSKQAYDKSIIRDNIHYVYNGIDLKKYPNSTEKNFEKYVWLSRIDPLKGPHIAIQAVKKAGKKLILSGIIDRTKYNDYFQNEINPLLGPDIKFEPAKGYERKLELFQKSKAFIFPIQWEEPFGLVVVEALSSGTPVITFNRGAMPEIIEEGRNGILVNPDEGVDGIARAIEKIESLSSKEYMNLRKQCREFVKEKFSYQLMSQNYLKLYSELIKEFEFKN